MANESSPRGFLSRFQIPPSKVDFSSLGFRLDRPAARKILEGVSCNHVIGFNIALSHPQDLHQALGELPEDQRGVGYEGAAMYASLVDMFTAGRAGALDRLLAGPGGRYIHVIHIGAGWQLRLFRTATMLGISAVALRLPRTPLYRWFALDGNSFAEVYFGGTPALLRRARMTPDAKWETRLQGCGRALWFVECGDPAGVEAVIEAAPELARPHLWAGIGLSSTYNGGFEDAELGQLVKAADRHFEYFGQGVVFAATARTRSGHVPEHTERACQQVLGVSSAEAGRWGEEEATKLWLTGSRDVTAYLTLKSRIREIIGTHR